MVGERPSRVLALDPGAARVGAALSDELRVLASPCPPLDARKPDRLLRAIAALCAEQGVGRILIGLPLDMSGEHGPAARKAIRFAQRVADATGLEIELVDERWTTVEAARRLDEAGRHGTASRSARIDGAAASVLLQSWLDARNREA